MNSLNIGGTFEELRLSNGLTVWLVQDPTQSLAWGSVVVRAGAKDSPNTGIAHYFEHMMFKGTTTIGTTDYSAEKDLLDRIADQYSRLQEAHSDEQRHEIQKEINHLNIEASAYAIPNDFSNLISKYGGSSLNAGTSYDYTVYYNSFTPEYIEHWCALYSERLVAPVFRLFQSELETVYEEKNMLSNNPFSAASRYLFDRLFAPHPYRYPIIGSTEALKSPDLLAMQEFFDTYYTAGNIGVILSGNLPSLAELKPLLENTFGRVKPGTPIRPTYDGPSGFNGKETFEIKHPIPALNLNGVYWQTVSNSHPDHLPLQLISAVMNNNGKTGLLDQIVLRHKATSLSSECISLNDCGFWGIISIPRTAPFAKFEVDREVKKALKQLKEGSFSDDLFTQAKLSLIRTQYETLERPNARQNYLQSLFSSYQTLDDTSRDLQRLQLMTKDELVAIAQKYLSDNRLYVTKKTGRYPYTPLQKPPYDPVTTTQNGATSDFANQLERLPSRRTKVLTLDLNKDYESTTLSTEPLQTLYRNGVSFNDLFQLTFTFYRGSYLHPIQELLAPYLDQVGGGGMKAKEFYDKLYRYGATLSFSTNISFFSITLKGYDKYFSQSVELLSSFLSDVEQNKGALKEARQELKLIDQTNKATPETLVSWLSSKIRFGDNASYLQTLNEAQAKQVTLADLSDELEKTLNTEVDIHYSGTLEMQEIKGKVSTIIPSTTSALITPAEPFIYLEAKPITAPELVLLHDPAATQSLIRGYLDLGHLTPEEELQATLLSSYLGGGMGSVLFQEIREYRSLAYNVWSTQITPRPVDRDKSSHLLIGMSTQHDKATTAIQLLTDLMTKLPLTPQRLENARHSIHSNAAALYPSPRQRSKRIAYLQRSGYSEDVAEQLIWLSQTATLDDLTQFYQNKVAGKPLSISVVGDKNVIGLDTLKSEYAIREVSQKEIFK